MKLTKKSRSEVLGEATVQEEQPKLAIEMRLDELETIFKAAVDAVEEMIAPGEDGKARELSVEEGHTLAEILGPQVSAPERVDQVVALIRHREYAEQLLRIAIRNAEMRARGHKAFVQSIKGSLELYMIERGIKRIDGFASTLKIAKSPDKLDIGNEEFIPEKFFDYSVVFKMPAEAYSDEELSLLKQRMAEEGLEFVSVHRFLQRDRLLEYLEGTHLDPETKNEKYNEVAGAELMRDRKRLDVK